MAGLTAEQQDAALKVSLTTLSSDREIQLWTATEAYTSAGETDAYLDATGEALVTAGLVHGGGEPIATRRIMLWRTLLQRYANGTAATSDMSTAERVVAVKDFLSYMSDNRISTSLTAAQITTDLGAVDGVCSADMEDVASGNSLYSSMTTPGQSESDEVRRVLLIDMTQKRYEEAP
jgi:hypothetical protein